MSDDDVRADARRLLSGITPGPWVAEYSREQGNCVIPADAQSTREAVAVTRLYHQVADAEFIAAAPALVDRLLTELDQALATLQQVRDLHRPTHEMCEHCSAGASFVRWPCDTALLVYTDPWRTHE